MLSAEFPLKDSAFFVALSGGVDSCVLLDMLISHAKGHPEMKVVVLHYDHRLQSESMQWAKFCRDLCVDYEIDFYMNDAGVEIDKKIGLEASARKARYMWFDEIMQQIMNNTDITNGVLLTAHHCNDQAETMLLNMIRGTGLKGLRGIAAKKDISKKDKINRQFLIRPLLDFTKNELQQYATQQKLQWVEDLSNQKDEFRRNAIRHNVIPALTEIKADASQQLNKLSRRVADAEMLMQEFALNDLSLSAQYDFSPFDHSYGLGLEGLRVFSVARQLNAIRCWLDLIQFPAESEMDLLKVLDWSLNGANSGAELRRGKRCYRYFQDTLYVMPITINDAESSIDWPLNWQDSSQSLPLSIYFHGSLEWELCCTKESKYYGSSLMLKTINEVSSILLPNGGGHIQSKKCFQAAKVPPWRRQNALFITQENSQFVSVLGGQKQDDFYLCLVDRQ